MKKFENISDFEKLLKDQLSDHSTPAPKDVWSNVAASTSQGAGLFAQLSAYFSSVTNVLKVALFAGGIASIGIIIVNENQTEVPTTDSITPIESIEEDSEANDKQSDIMLDQLDTDTPGETAILKETKPTSQGSNQTVALQHEQQDDGLNTLPEVPNNIPNEEVIETNREPDENITSITASVSNLSPCIGEEIDLISNQAGIWFLNKTPISSQGTLSKYKVPEKGTYQIEFRTQDFAESFTIDASSNEITIAEGIETDGLKEFSLVDPSSKANWFLDGKLLSTETNNISLKVLKVGTHLLRAESVNKTCSSSSEYAFKIKPTGSIKTYNVFTPDGDGRNDTYVVEIENYDFFSIQIFDNQMNLLFASQNPNNEWNGNNQRTGEEVPSGEYSAKINYKLRGEEPTTKNIRLTLKRP